LTTNEILRNTRAKVKGKVMLEREFRQRIARRKRPAQTPETMGGRKDAAGEVHRKEQMKKEGRGAGMQWMNPSCPKTRNAACTGL
jgi:hypothetical protein